MIATMLVLVTGSPPRSQIILPNGHSESSFAPDYGPADLEPIAPGMLILHIY